MGISLDDLLKRVVMASVAITAWCVMLVEWSRLTEVVPLWFVCASLLGYLLILVMAVSPWQEESA